MIVSSFVIFLIIQVLVLSGLAFIFNKTIKAPGLQKLNRFTVYLLLACTVMFFLPLTGVHLYNFPELLPNLFIIRWPKPVMFTIAIFIQLFFIISMLKIWKGRNLHVLIAVWVVLALLNIFELTGQALVVYSYTGVYTKSYDSYLDVLTGSNKYYLLILIKPFRSPLFWLAISCISLLKIRKEKRTEALPALS